MIVMVCVDDKGGMLFNHRRQSKDKVLRQELLRLAGESPLRVTPYTAKQFTPEEQPRLAVSPEALTDAAPGDFCCVEDQPLAPVADAIEQIVLFRWNRDYPADTYLDVNLAEGWHCTERCDFAGSSHETITKEIYTR